MTNDNTKSFEDIILEVIKEDFNSKYKDIFDKSLLLQYVKIKTKSAERGSKSRSSFANLYAIYVLVEDYLKGGYDKSGKYKDYEGAIFTNLFRRQRELPFGGKLQNHALNNRLNEEYKKFFPTSDQLPIIRDVAKNRYWFNENLLEVYLDNKSYNIAKTVIKIINKYIEVKKASFEIFLKECEEIIKLEKADNNKAIDFIKGLLAPNVDARIFEIVSYSILKYYYSEEIVYFGFSLENIKKYNLILYRTGRTNANDGGIDFVMKPLGRFFQVTETTDVHKFFLDIDKVERYPVTFVIKSNDDVPLILEKMREKAEEIYKIKAIVQKYMGCIEELINIPKLIEYFDKAIDRGYLKSIIQEIVIESKVEFNISEFNISEEDIDEEEN